MLFLPGQGLGHADGLLNIVLGGLGHDHGRLVQGGALHPGHHPVG